MALAYDAAQATKDATLTQDQLAARSQVPAPTSTPTDTSTPPTLANGQTAGGLQIPAPTTIDYSKLVNANGTVYNSGGATANTTPEGGYASPDQLAKDLGTSTSGIDWAKITADPNYLKKQALAKLQNGGGAPQDSSTGTSTAKDTLNKTIPPDTSNIEAQLANDPGYQQLLQDQKDYSSTLNQQGTLLDQYKQMETDAGIPGLNTQLLNTEKIINGTEDDIRKEVQAAGGFATDSQVMALSSARNKTLIQNYNNLLKTKTDAENHINTMIGLAKEDKANALNAVTQKLNIDEQINTYRDKMVSASNEAYNNVIKSLGYSGLIDSLQGDPSAIATVEKSLGLQPGGLQQLADIQKSQANTKLAESARVSSQFANSNGEFFNVKTGQAYATPQDFFKAAGVKDFAEAYSKGLVTDVKAPTDNKNLPASAQEYEYAKTQGYKGTYEQYQNEDANRKRSINTPIPPEEKILDAFNKSVSGWDKKGTREQFARQLQAQYPDIDPNDIERKVGEVYPNGYDS